MIDPVALAVELLAAYSTGREVALPPSSRDSGFDLTAAYAVESELTRLRRASGRTTVGFKVGFANKAVWRMLKLETLVWAHMYDDTVQYAPSGEVSFSLANRRSPRIEPEIVFKLKEPPNPAAVDAAAVLQSVEWLAFGYEIVDCLFPDWKFRPADFVAAFGLHAGLVIGRPRRVEPESMAVLVEQLAGFKVKLWKNGQIAGEGGGRNVLRSPALCLGELAAAIARRPGAEPLAAGDLVSSGSLTDSHPMSAGEEWRAELEGIDLPGLVVRTS
jgi:2-oxo-3-hexenedioate decarboxylase